MPDSLSELAQQPDEFAKELGWQQSHSPKNLASARLIEAGELLESVRQFPRLWPPARRVRLKAQKILCINRIEANLLRKSPIFRRLCFMVIDAQVLAIATVAVLKSGHPFRGTIDGSENGDALAVQMKDVDPANGVDWGSVTRTTLVGRKQPDWLKAGDILFASKGARFYAVCIDEPPSPAVCSPHFFLLRAAPHAPLLPAFLAWQINQPPFQRQLQQAAEGSSQLSIRRPVLEALALSLPSLADQQRIVALADLAKRERHVLETLIHHRERQLQALAEDLAFAAQVAH